MSSRRVGWLAGLICGNPTPMSGQPKLSERVIRLTMRIRGRRFRCQPKMTKAGECAHASKLGASVFLHFQVEQEIHWISCDFRIEITSLSSLSFAGVMCLDVRAQLAVFD